MRSFLRESVSVLSRRSLFLVVLNWLFFGAILVGALLTSWDYVGLQLLPLDEDFLAVDMSNLPLAILSIFLFNLLVSGFLLVTFSGLVFFALPVAFLVIRGLLWGSLLAGSPTSLFLAALPTLVLKGEGYVLACVVGFVLGLSWLKPAWVFKEWSLSRVKSLKQAFSDCVRVYVVVAVVLFAAAVVEAVTIVSL